MSFCSARRRLPLTLAAVALALGLMPSLAACTRPAAAPGASVPATAPAPAAPEVTLTAQASGTDALLISADAVSETVAWAVGTGGTVLRTTDSGRTWQQRPVPGADSLQFRDVKAMSARTAYVLSIGAGAASRIYKTSDGGASWTLQFANDDPQAFFDCMAFWVPETPGGHGAGNSAYHGFAFSDAVEGPDGAPQFVVLTTADGGETWTRVPQEHLPRAYAGEGSFAASGTCAAAHGERHGWIGTGNAAGRPARVLRTTDRGRTWQAAPTPIDAGEAAGIASVVFRDAGGPSGHGAGNSALHGFAFGGDIGRPARTDSSAARTTDGGRTWRPAPAPPFDGPVYGAAYVPGAQALVAVGPGGAGYSVTDGRSWVALSDSTYWGVAFASPQGMERATRGWLVGPNGRIAHVRFRPGNAEAER